MVEDFVHIKRRDMASKAQTVVVALQRLNKAIQWIAGALGEVYLEAIIRSGADSTGLLGKSTKDSVRPG
jgi:hypothetical protein